MSGSPVTGHPRYERGPVTYQVYAAVTVGQLVAPGTAGNAGLVAPAGANANNCVGLATTSALPAGTAYAGTSLAGFPLVESGMPDEDVACAQVGVYAVNATGTIAFGDPVKCGANGSVVKWVSGTDGADLKIGRCVDPTGATNGTTVLVRLNIG